jgi:tetratricopeptide (TPR) repeat protein
MVLAVFTFLAFSLFAEENAVFKEGSDLYRNRKFDEARVKFEQALARDATDERIYLYLGVTYQQLKKYAKAVEVLQKGLPLAVEKKPLILYQLGVCYDEKGLADFASAEKYYTQAITENNVFPEPYLNRGLVVLKTKRYKETIDDCKTYLKLWPETPKRKEVEKLIALLEQDVANQQKLLDSILNSLKNASTDTQTNSAGTEEFKDTKKDEGDILD